MKPPCEVIVWYVIPTIRAELAKELVKMGMSQKEISQRLGITQSAVSQYIKDKRGKCIPINKEVRKGIKLFAKQVMTEKNPKDTIPGLCMVCAIVKSSGSLCELHKKDDASLEGCDVCFESGKLHTL
jgi:predicted transcriptional regulator